MKYIMFLGLILMSVGFTPPAEVRDNPEEYVVYGDPRFPQDSKIMADLKADILADGLEIVRPAKNFNGYVVKSNKPQAKAIASMKARGHLMEGNLIYRIPDKNRLKGRHKAGLKCKKPGDPPDDPGDPGGPQPPQKLHWGLLRAEAPAAWADGHTGAGITIAVLDTGIDKNHPDLIDNIVGGEDFTSTGDFWDGHSHGTHCAGIAAAVFNNIGTVGVAPDASIWAGKVLDDEGFGSNADITDGIYGAILAEVHIMSMSFGGGGFSSGIEGAMDAAFAAGIQLYCAAGNESTSQKTWPAASQYCVAVASMDQGDIMSGFSNYGDWVAVIAPGGRIFSTVPNDSYDTYSGTSMATPFYAGFAAMALSKSKNKVHEDIEFQAWDGSQWTYPFPNVRLTMQ